MGYKLGVETVHFKYLFFYQAKKKKQEWKSMLKLLSEEEEEDEEGEEQQKFLATSNLSEALINYEEESNAEQVVKSPYLM